MIASQKNEDMNDILNIHTFRLNKQSTGKTNKSSYNVKDAMVSIAPMRLTITFNDLLFLSTVVSMAATGRQGRGDKTITASSSKKCDIVPLSLKYNTVGRTYNASASARQQKYIGISENSAIFALECFLQRL